MSSSEDFVWCPSECGSGQLHASRETAPIVTCIHCSHKFCFEHKVPWHTTMSCREYNLMLADPENFRTRMEQEDEEYRSQRDEETLNLNKAREFEGRQRREEAERERARKAAQVARQIAMRRKEEEEKSYETVRKTTKPCPGCGWAIEKNDGW